LVTLAGADDVSAPALAPQRTRALTGGSPASTSTRGAHPAHTKRLAHGVEFAYVAPSGITHEAAKEPGAITASASCSGPVTAPLPPPPPPPPPRESAPATAPMATTAAASATRMPREGGGPSRGFGKSAARSAGEADAAWSVWVKAGARASPQDMAGGRGELWAWCRGT